MGDGSDDLVDIAEAADQTRSQEPGAGWYPDPKGQGERYFDGTKWTDERRPSSSASTGQPTQAEAGPTGAQAAGAEESTAKTVLWGLSLGFGATGAVGVVAIPILAFYFPLGFGMGGAALAVAAWSTGGRSPWWAWVAVGASVAALIAGGSAYSDFNETSERTNDAIEDLRLP